jgi:molybdenum-dependent DNA-binding transcriptional regulator ModE
VKGLRLATRIADRTPAQMRALIRQHGSVRAAARWLGLPKSTVQDMAHRRVKQGLRKHMEIAR